MFICKICGSAVEAGQAFCDKCGADVVDNYETVCQSCDARNRAGSRYCAKCGGILSVLNKPICAVCGNKNLPGAKFCITCGAPIIVSPETHADSDILDVRRVKQRLDLMERERIQSIEREIAVKRKKVLEEKARIMQEVDMEKKRNDREFEFEKKQVDNYRAKLNELGAEDVNQLKKISVALKNYAMYYADPSTQLSDNQITNESYICPSCGYINPLDALSCLHCGRNKARATLLLSKGKIKQSPPIKRKKDIIAAPELDLTVKHTPTFDEFVASDKSLREKDASADEKQVPKIAANFSGGNQNFGYPYPQYGYPPMGGGMGGGGMMGGYGAPSFYNQQTGEPYQMPPILQPVAFVPYVTQDQPLVQYVQTEAASLSYSNQQGINSQGGSPQGAYQQGANSQGTYPQGAYKQGINPQGNNPQGAYQQGANPLGGNLQGVARTQQPKQNTEGANQTARKNTQFQPSKTNKI